LSCMPRNLRDEFLNKSFELRICCMPVHGSQCMVLTCSYCEDSCSRGKMPA
jgi:hypothetical protein